MYPSQIAHLLLVHDGDCYFTHLTGVVKTVGSDHSRALLIRPAGVVMASSAAVCVCGCVCHSFISYSWKGPLSIGEGRWRGPGEERNRKKGGAQGEGDGVACYSTATTLLRTCCDNVQ